MWGEAWALLHPILVEREVAHFKDVVAYVSPTLEILPSWGAEFAHTATTAAEAVPESARGALRMCEDLLEVLVEQPPMDRYAIRLDLAGLQFRAGQPDEARASAQALIDANPKCAGGYVMMAQYLVGPDLAGAPLGVKTQALEYARKGAACADAEDWEADEIVKDLSG